MTREAFLNALSQDGAEVEAALDARLLARKMPPLLRESMAYSLFAGGKRLRPALCFESCRMLGGDMDAALICASALEMIHTYSLIHDDLPAMDNDGMRRGKPSSHVRFGEGNAILAGDGLLSLAFEALAETGRPEVVRAVAAGAFDMVSGQSLDLAPAGDQTDLALIQRLKTGALMRAAVLSGAHCAAAPQAALDALSAFTEAYGLLFQITDDILDAEGDAELVGKSLGKDAAEGKLTFVTRLGLDGAKREADARAQAAQRALCSLPDGAPFFYELIAYTRARRA